SSVILFLLCYSDPHRYLHSFPTRRSSDLIGKLFALVFPLLNEGPHFIEILRQRAPEIHFETHGFKCIQSFPVPLEKRTSILQQRSEEHTSELQSRFDLVCRLLLEKKK